MWCLELQQLYWDNEELSPRENVLNMVEPKDGRNMNIR